MNKIGIMQGRFTDKGGFYPQEFPWENWEREFATGAANGITCIEWMFNYENYTQNPIWTDSGRKRLLRCMEWSGVAVESVCGNFFMEKGLFGDCLQREGAFEVLEALLEGMSDVGARILVLPLFEQNRPLSEKGCLECIRQILVMADRYQIHVLLENDWDASVNRKLLDTLGVEHLGVCYDLGNAAGAGKDLCEEILLLQDRIKEFHIKDKPYNGSSVMLGEGAVNFPKVMGSVRDMEIRVPFIFESYYGESAIEDTFKNIRYFKNVLTELNL